MKGKLSTLPVSYRLAVTSRVLAAVLGGYVVAALASVSPSVALSLAALGVLASPVCAVLT